jgi:NodT family efflux transporter outer membrane factor (OMF) lipoprotein
MTCFEITVAFVRLGPMSRKTGTGQANGAFGNAVLSMSKYVLILILALIAGAGCRVGPDYCGPPLTSLEPSWQVLDEDPSVQVDHALVSGWWLGFQDPLLNQLIQEAVAQNLDLREAALRVVESRRQRCVVRADLFPQFSQSNSFTHRKQAIAGGFFAGIGGLPGANIRSNLDQWTMGLDGSWEIDVFGRIRRLVEAADADIAVTQEDYRDVLVILLADVATNYVNARAFERRLELARENLKTQQRTLELTEKRFRAELTGELDVAQARVNVASTASDIPTLEAGYQLALNRLSVLLGTPPGTVDGWFQQRAAIPRPPSEIAIGIPAELMRRRPDIRRAERELAAQTARIGAAVGELYPKFSILGSFGLDARQFDLMFQRNGIGASIGPNMQWQIFSYGRLRCNVLVQEARRDQRAIRYQATVLRAAEEVNNALVNYVRETQRVGYLEKSVAASQRSVELSGQRYIGGDVSFQRVLDSQRSLLVSQDLLALSQANVALNLISLYRALGGGWRLPPAAPQLIEEVPAPPPADGGAAALPTPIEALP